MVLPLGCRLLLLLLLPLVRLSFFSTPSPNHSSRPGKFCTAEGVNGHLAGVTFTFLIFAGVCMLWCGGVGIAVTAAAAAVAAAAAAVVVIMSSNE